MKAIHRLLHASVLAILMSTLALQTAIGAVRHSAKQRARQSVKQPARRQAKTQRRRSDETHSTSRASRAERIRIAARRRAEAARLAALARQRAADEAMRREVQSLIAKDDTAGEDPEIRRIAVNALGNHAGTVVVMNPKTGRIYSIVNQQWAIREGFKPCSTIKLVTGLAGLNEGVINAEDTRTIAENNQVSLTSALAHSKNEYFQTVGGRVGFSKMISYARELGLGERTGINTRNESAGRVPPSKSGLAVNHMSSHGDDFKVTALQLATLAATIANGGKLLTPFIARTAQDENRATPTIRRRVDIGLESFQEMIPGMIGSVRYGSGRLAFDPQATVAGKTGTCIERGTWVGLFTSYAPLNDPQISIAVIARGSDGRNHFPAAVAGRIYRELNSRMDLSAGIDLTVKSQTSSLPAVAEADTDSDEEEAGDSNEAGANSAATQTPEPARVAWRDQRKTAESKVKPTVMLLPNRGGMTNTPSTTQTSRRTNTPQQ